MKYSIKWNHDTSDLGDAFGVPKKEREALFDRAEKLFDETVKKLESEGKDPSLSRSEQVEVALKAAKTDGEAMLIVYLTGVDHGRRAAIQSGIMKAMMGGNDAN